MRNYIANGGGAAKVSHAILGGTPNHGVRADPDIVPGNEFNGAGPFLMALNVPKGPGGERLPAGAAGVEITPGLKWMTIRSDNNDKFAQPDGLWIGSKGTPTNVSFEGPALKGAYNVVLPGRDHRETAYHPQAFAAAFQFVTGRSAVTPVGKHSALLITPEARVVLGGEVGGLTAAGPTNLPLVDAQVTVYAVDPATGARQGAALVDMTVGADGRWGPITTDSRTPLEIVLAAPGFATTHFYRSPFLRSSDLVNLRPERLAETDKTAGAVVSFSRPRAYFGLPRDSVLLDGAPAAGIPTGVAGIATVKLKLDSAVARPVVGEFRSGVISERIVGVTWPAKDNQLTVLELHE